MSKRKFGTKSRKRVRNQRKIRRKTEKMLRKVKIGKKDFKVLEGRERWKIRNYKN